MTTSLRIAFMGSPDFSVPILGALRDAGHGIAAVYCRPPRPAGRGQKERKCAVHAAADEAGLEVRTPKSLKGEAARADFAALDPDAAVVAAYGLILPKAILDVPKHGCLNVHASLLPRWRGAAPIQRAIEAGDAETGVTIMQMDEGLDTGGMLLAERVAITPAATGGSLHDELSAVGARLIVEALGGLAEGALEATPQPGDGVTYARKLDRAEARIDFSEPAQVIERRLRAFDPWPGGYTELEGARLKILSAVVSDGSGAPGVTLDEALTIGCGRGSIAPTRVQLAGKSPMSTGDFLRGTPVPAGIRLGDGD